MTMQGTRNAEAWAAARRQRLVISPRAALDLAAFDDPRRVYWDYDEVRLAIECGRRTLPWRYEMGTFWAAHWELVRRSWAAKRGWITRRRRAAQ